MMMVSAKELYHPILCILADNVQVSYDGLASGRVSGKVTFLFQPSPWIAVTIPRPSLERLTSYYLKIEVPLSRCSCSRQILH